MDEEAGSDEHEVSQEIAELRAKHREETLQQQQFHLQQLKLLQDKLLSDLMEQINIDDSVNEDMKKDILQSLGLDTVPTMRDTTPTIVEDIESISEYKVPISNVVTMATPSNVQVGTPQKEKLINYKNTCESIQQFPLPTNKSPHTDTVRNESRTNTTCTIDPHTKDHTGHNPVPLACTYRHELSSSSGPAQSMGVSDANKGMSPQPIRWSLPNSAALYHRHGNANTVQSTSTSHNVMNWRNQYGIEENERLQIKCEELQSQIDDYEKLIGSLEEKVKRLKRQLSTCEEDCSSKERFITTLQTHISSMEATLNRYEETVAQMSSRLSGTEEALHKTQRDQSNSKEVLRQAMKDLEQTDDKRKALLARIRSLESTVEDQKLENSELRAAIDQHEYTANQYRSTIHHLENEVRTLQHLNNRLHGQIGHFMISSPDENKTPLLDRREYESEYNISDGKHKIERDIVDDHNDVQYGSSYDRQKQRLTKKKWLETSEGGLVFGSPAINTPSGGRGTRYKDEMRSPPLASLTNQTSPMHSPAHNHTHTTKGSPVGNILQAVRGGTITTTTPTRHNKSIEERVEERMRIISDAEKKLVQLQREKEQLESFLQKAPPFGKVTLESKKQKREAENKLDGVLKEIGTVKMVLRNAATFRK